MFHSVTCNIYSSSLPSLPDFLKRLTHCFIHHRLSSGRMIFDSPDVCPRRNLSFSSSSPYDHFLIYSSSSANTKLLLTTYHQHSLSSSSTSSLQQHILHSLSKLHNIDQSSRKYSISSSTFTFKYICSPLKLRLVGTTSSVVDYHLPLVPLFNNNILTKKNWRKNTSNRMISWDNYVSLPNPFQIMERILLLEL